MWLQMHFHTGDDDLRANPSQCWFLKIQIRFAAEDFGPVNFKNLIKLFLRSYGTCILIKLIKGKITSIRFKEIFLASRVDNLRSFSHDLPSRSSSLQGTCGRTNWQRFFRALDILNTWDQEGWMEAKKDETLSLFFSLNFDHQEATMNCVVSFSTLRVFPLIYNVPPIDLNPWIKWHLNNYKETLILLGF